MSLSPLNQRRWRNFKANKRAYWSLIIFSVLFGVSLFAEVLANDKPLLVTYRGEWRMPFLKFYSEADFGGDFRTEANYKSPEVQCLIKTGGLVDCFDAPDEMIAAVDAGAFDAGTEGFSKGVHHAVRTNGMIENQATFPRVVAARFGFGGFEVVDIVDIPGVLTFTGDRLATD